MESDSLLFEKRVIPLSVCCLDLEDQPVFYDAVEDVDQLSSDEEMPSLMLTDPRLKNIKTKLKSVQMRRAKLRNKKVSKYLTFCVTVLYFNYFWGRKLLKTSGKRRKCWLPAFSPFSAMFLQLYKRGFMKTSWKKEKMLVTSIFLFPTLFFTLSKTKHSNNIYFLSANALNLVMSKFFSFCKELMVFKRGLQQGNKR